VKHTLSHGLGGRRHLCRPTGAFTVAIRTESVFARLLPHVCQFIAEVTAELDLSNLRSFGIKVGVAANLLGEREIATAFFRSIVSRRAFPARAREQANKLENKDLATLRTLNGPASSPFR
jgi:hypothetical protein